jgi:hypothetical protein
MEEFMQNLFPQSRLLTSRVWRTETVSKDAENVLDDGDAR